MSKLRTIKIYWNYGADHLLLPHIKFFLKDKKRPGTRLPASFSAWFLKKNISHTILLTNQILLSGCLYFLRYWAICVYLSIKPFFRKAFFIIFKGLSFKQKKKKKKKWKGEPDFIFFTCCYILINYKSIHDHALDFWKVNIENLKYLSFVLNYKYFCRGNIQASELCNAEFLVFVGFYRRNGP